MELGRAEIARAATRLAWPTHAASARWPCRPTHKRPSVSTCSAFTAQGGDARSADLTSWGRVPPRVPRLVFVLNAGGASVLLLGQLLPVKVG